MHHIISDAWSYSKIIEQFVKNYELLEKTGNVTEDEVPSYISYINSTEEYKNSEKYRKDEEFWKEYLDGISSKISIKDNAKKIFTDFIPRVFGKDTEIMQAETFEEAEWSETTEKWQYAKEITNEDNKTN